MSISQPGDSYRYSIDRNAVIVGVGENWQAFAEENQAAESLSPVWLLGTSLWDHIHDRETRYLYQTILDRMGEDPRSATFPFRCDSPELRRYLELIITPQKNGAFEFRSRILKTEPRQRVTLLETDVERSTGLVHICSMCKKIDVGNDHWLEVEDAIGFMRLFEQELMPQLSHGICPSCFDKAMMVLDRGS